jgi:hypothetical protein
VQDPILLNKTSRTQGWKRHPNVQSLYEKAVRHKEYGPQMNITEENHEENPGKEDSPPVNEDTHGQFQHTTEYPELFPHHGDDIHEY